MVETMPPGWPRLDTTDAIGIAAELASKSPAEALSLVKTGVEGLRFYPTAPSRVNKEMLDEVRAGVVELAAKYGYPGNRSTRSWLPFDRELALLFASSVPMLPVEAYDIEVWHFITLRVLPDIAVWRWPADPGDVSHSDPADEPNEYSGVRGVARYTDRRRGIFREAWLRGYLLGDACMELDSDNFIQLTDRITLTGNLAIAKLLADTHISMLGRAEYHRRNGLRIAMRLVGQACGRIAVESLPAVAAQQLVLSCFERACTQEVASRTAAADTDEAVVESSGDEPMDSSSSASLRFLALIPEYARHLTPLFSAARADATELMRQAEQHARDLTANVLATRIVADLRLLLDDWDTFNDDERGVAWATLAYFVADDDAVADTSSDGLLDDDEIVDAAFTALGRERGTDWIRPERDDDE